MNSFSKVSVVSLVAVLMVLAGCSSGGCKVSVSKSPLARMAPVPLQDIHFAFNSAELSPVAKQTLRKNVKSLGLDSAGNKTSIVLEGHADERGDVGYNKRLSEQRVASVKEYIMSLGVREDLMRTYAVGESNPPASGVSAGAWAENRSVRVSTVS